MSTIQKPIQKKSQPQAIYQASRNNDPPSSLMNPSDQYYRNLISPIHSQKSVTHFLASLSIITTLTKTNRTTVVRGVRSETTEDVILKMILVFRKSLHIYEMILGQANLYYQRHKPSIHDLIKVQDKIAVWTNSRNIPTFKQKDDEQIYLEFVRPYLDGRNFHQEVYVHSKFPFDTDQMADFIKRTVKTLTFDTHQPTFIPTLDNIYFNGTDLVGNLTSFETYMFLRGEGQHLSTQNFKQLYILLPSDPTVFCQWKKMREYLFETIKVKAFLVLLFCLCTIRSPIEMIFGEKLNQQDLERPRLIDQNTNKIKEENKAIKLIRENPIRWSSLLKKVQNEVCLRKASQQIFYQLKAGKQPQNQTNRDIKLTNQESNYLTNIFHRVFVEQKSLGQSEQRQLRWKDFFDVTKGCEMQEKRQYDPKAYSQYLKTLQPLRDYVVSVSVTLNELDKKQSETNKKPVKTQNSGKKVIRIPKQEYETSEDSQIEKPQVKKVESMMADVENKRYATKISFFYLHKYFLAEDIKNRNLNPSQAAKFARSLNFQTYLPMKFQIQLNQTLDYVNWYEILFEEMEDHRPGVYDAAKKIETLIKQKSVDIMKTVKGCELTHLKRIEYIVVKKLSQKKEQTDELMELKEEIREFFQWKMFAQMLESGENLIRNAQKLSLNQEEITKVQIKGMEDLKLYEGQEYNDVKLLMNVFVKIVKMQKTGASQIEWTNEEKKSIGRMLEITDAMKGKAKLTSSMRKMLKEVRNQMEIS